MKGAIGNLFGCQIIVVPWLEWRENAYLVSDAYTVMGQIIVVPWLEWRENAYLVSDAYTVMGPSTAVRFRNFT